MVDGLKSKHSVLFHSTNGMMMPPDAYFPVGRNNERFEFELNLWPLGIASVAQFWEDLCVQHWGTQFNHVWGWVEASNHQPTRTCSDYIRNVPPQHFHMWSYRCQKIQKSNQHVTDPGHIKVREHQNLAEKKWMLIFIPIAPSWWHDCSGSGLWTFDPKPPHRRQWATCGIYQKKNSSLTPHVWCLIRV